MTEAERQKLAAEVARTRRLVALALDPEGLLEGSELEAERRRIRRRIEALDNDALYDEAQRVLNDPARGQIAAMLGGAHA